MNNNCIKITLLGDIMCKNQMIQVYKTCENKYDFSGVFKPMEKMFSESDLVLGNMETPISIDNTNLTYEQYAFNSPYEFAEAVYNSGIKFVATANNHCLDMGVDGINSTVNSLNRIGLLHTGIYNDKNIEPSIVKVNGLKIGIMSYTYGTNAFSNGCYLKKKEYWKVNLFQNQELSNRLTNWCFHNEKNVCARIYNKLLRIINPVNARKQLYERKEFSYGCKRKLLKNIKKIKEKRPDFIIMYMHMGGQYNNEATIETKKLSSFLIKKGVNIVAGSHEHVVHGGRFDAINENKIETYSLGNFCGTAGVYEAPFDKKSEYSIALHIYLSKKNINKVTYSILKTVRDNNIEKGIKTIPVYDLINEVSDIGQKEQLFKDIIYIAKKFTDHDISKEGILKEYELFSNMSM